MSGLNRDDSRTPIKLALSQRAGLICSNPACSVRTSGPQSDPSKSLSIGVAAHISAASPAGPRFDPKLSASERCSALNGIWLCQNCAKLVDNDPIRFPTELLQAWKISAEMEAGKRIGKVIRNKPTEQRRIEEIRRPEKLRDYLDRGLLKTHEQRMASIKLGYRSRLEKFAKSEVIIHTIEDESYPNQVAASQATSGWFKLEIMDFYSGGVEFVLDISYVAYSEENHMWAPIPWRKQDDLLPSGISRRKVFKIARIPWRNILHFNLEGDQDYPQPHLYCRFADNGMPYAKFAYYDITGHNRRDFEFPLQPDGQTSFELILSSSRSSPSQIQP